MKAHLKDSKRELLYSVLSCVQLFVIHGLYVAWDSSVHGIFQARILQGIFPTHLLHWQADSLPLYHLGCPSKGEMWYKFEPELNIQFSSVQSLCRVWLFETPWTTARQVTLTITNSRSLPKLMSIESVMPSNHLILWCPLLFLPSIFPSIRVFSNESALCNRWPKYWSFNFNISPFNEHPGLISFRMDWLDGTEH